MKLIGIFGIEAASNMMNRAFGMSAYSDTADFRFSSRCVESSLIGIQIVNGLCVMTYRYRNEYSIPMADLMFFADMLLRLKSSSKLSVASFFMVDFGNPQSNCQ